MDFFKSLEKSNLYLNENQKLAVSTVEGPALIVAGPGSGKTSVITARVAYMVLDAKIDPSNILVITFTRAAANEMKERFETFPNITQTHIKKVDFGTFHSVFYKIINSYYGRYISVISQDKIRDIIKKALVYVHESKDSELISNILNDISLIRTGCKDMNTFRPEYISKAKFTTVYNIYQSQKKKIRCIDFDDMLIICKNILETDESFLMQYRNKYKYFLIDEFQDTNSIQFDIVKLIAHPLNNICVVGDDDQSIYSFRGTDAHCLIDFESNFEDCKTIILNINYRSTENIINQSKKIISNNTIRKEKDIKPARECGGEPVFFNPIDERAETILVIDTICDLLNKGLYYKDFAILYRTNIQSRAIIDELFARNIPFNIKDNINDFYEHWICRDLTAYLNLCTNNYDIYSFSKIVNKPVRYINREVIDEISKNYYNYKCSIPEAFDLCNIKEFQFERLIDLFKSLSRISKMTPICAIKYIRGQIGYDGYITTYCMDANIKKEGLVDIMEEYETASSSFSTISEFLHHIDEISNKLKKGGKYLNKYKTDSITLSTIHSAKGLEFTCVFIIGVIEGMIPHKKAIENGENIEEERRLFYVGVTRAKDLLFVSSPKSYHGSSAKPSRFYNEAIGININIDNNKKAKKLNFKVGDIIKHNFFGIGRILDITKNLIIIQFNNKNGVKNLDIDTCMQKKLLE